MVKEKERNGRWEKAMVKNNGRGGHVQQKGKSNDKGERTMAKRST